MVKVDFFSLLKHSFRVIRQDPVIVTPFIFFVLASRLLSDVVAANSFLYQSGSFIVELSIQVIVVLMAMSIMSHGSIHIEEVIRTFKKQIMRIIVVFSVVTLPLLPYTIQLINSGEHTDVASFPPFLIVIVAVQIIVGFYLDYVLFFFLKESYGLGESLSRSFYFFRNNVWILIKMNSVFVFLMLIFAYLFSFIFFIPAIGKISFYIIIGSVVSLFYILNTVLFVSLNNGASLSVEA